MRRSLTLVLRVQPLQLTIRVLIWYSLRIRGLHSHRTTYCCCLLYGPYTAVVSHCNTKRMSIMKSIYSGPSEQLKGSGFLGRACECKPPSSIFKHGRLWAGGSSVPSTRSISITYFDNKGNLVKETSATRICLPLCTVMGHLASKGS
jgi:hypothetical protein